MNELNVSNKKNDINEQNVSNKKNDINGQNAINKKNDINGQNAINKMTDINEQNVSNKMTDQEKNVYFEKYNQQMFLFGRIMLAIAAFLLISVPILIGIINETTADLSGIMSAIAKVGTIYIPVGIVEFLVYSPMLGVSGSYLTFLTGNVTNLKIPCVMNAKDIAKVEEGTPESEIVSSISVATSSIVTMLVLLVGVILLVPLTPILQDETLIPAFDNVVPALFGALALKYFLKAPKIAVIPLVLMILLCVLVPSMIKQTSILLLPAGGLALAIGYVLWKKDKL